MPVIVNITMIIIQITINVPRFSTNLYNIFRVGPYYSETLMARRNLTQVNITITPNSNSNLIGKFLSFSILSHSAFVKILKQFVSMIRWPTKFCSGVRVPRSKDKLIGLASIA